MRLLFVIYQSKLNLNYYLLYGIYGYMFHNECYIAFTSLLYFIYLQNYNKKPKKIIINQYKNVKQHFHYGQHTIIKLISIFGLSLEWRTLS